MPDAVTHLLTARVAGALLRRPEPRAILYLGVLWPDLLAKGTQAVLHCPPGFDVPSHSIPGLLVACWGAALLFGPARREAAFGLLMAGSLLHLAADLLKDYGVYSGLRLFFPFSDRGFSLGLFRSEESAFALPVAAALLLTIELVARRRSRVGG